MGAFRAAVVLAALAATGCATDREVSVRLPITRLELPEPSPRTFGLGTATANVVTAQLTPDQTTTTPDPDAPVLADDAEHEYQHRFDWQVARPVMVSLRSFGEDFGGVQVKWSPYAPRRTGRGGSLSLTVAYGEGDSDFHFSGGDDRSHTSIDQRLADVAAIFGWRTGPALLVFGGPYFTRHTYDGTYRSRRGSDPDVDTTFSGDARLAGANLGLAYTPTDWFSGIAEVSGADVKAGRSHDRFAILSVALQFHFGRLYRPAVPPAPERPVEVVPAR